jgi:hypothetical protein
MLRARRRQNTNSTISLLFRLTRIPTMALLRRLSLLRLSGLAQQQSELTQRLAFSATAQADPSSSPFYAVPEGHQNSDLSSEACHIGLSRRKDLTLREDVRLMCNGEMQTLAQLLKVRSTCRHRSPLPPTACPPTVSHRPAVHGS